MVVQVVLAALDVVVVLDAPAVKADVARDVWQVVQEPLQQQVLVDAD